jgi:hypothetical protein
MQDDAARSIHDEFSDEALDTLLMEMLHVLHECQCLRLHGNGMGIRHLRACS